MPTTRVITWEITTTDGTTVTITIGSNPEPINVTIDNQVDTPVMITLSDDNCLRFARFLTAVVSDN